MMEVERAITSKAAPFDASIERPAHSGSPQARFLDGYEAATRWPGKALTRLRVSRAEAIAASEMLRGLKTSDRAAVIEGFLKVAPLVRRASDRDAKAFTVGAVVERGVGRAPVSGRFIRYVRATPTKPARLLSGLTVGSVTHLSAGVSARLFCSSNYGTAAELSTDQLQLRGFEAGLGPFALSTMRGRGESAEVRGVSLWFSVGLNIGPVPLSGLGLIKLEDQAEATFELSPEEAAKIETALVGAKSWRAWHQFMNLVRAPFRVLPRGPATDEEMAP